MVSSLEHRDVGFESQEQSTREFEGRGSDHHVLGRYVDVSKNSLKRRTAIDRGPAGEVVHAIDGFCAGMSGESRGQANVSA